MSGPISFTPYTGWVDVADPLNIPSDVRVISASDLLRYENFGSAAAAKINENATNIATNTTNIATHTTNIAANAAAITTLQGTVSGHTTSIAANTSAITALQAPPALATKTASYTLIGTDNIVVANGASLTLTLPSASLQGAGKKFTLKNINSTALTVASVAGTLDGAATASLIQWAKATYVSDGTNWLSI